MKITFEVMPSGIKVNYTDEKGNKQSSLFPDITKARKFAIKLKESK